MDLRDAWLDLVAGAACVGCGRPGRVLCRGCATSLGGRPVVAHPDPRPHGLVEARAAGAYDGLLQAMVLAHKERRAFALARPLGAALAGVVRELVDRPSLTGARVLLVPVPSRPAVVAARGHDPMLRVVRCASRQLRRTDPDVRAVALLRQTTRPRDQAGLSAAERRDNVRGTMAARSSALAALARAGAPVVAVVCDDVVTTGSTAREAQRALEAVGVPVAGVASVAATERRVTVSPTTV